MDRAHFVKAESHLKFSPAGTVEILLDLEGVLGQARNGTGCSDRLPH